MSPTAFLPCLLERPPLAAAGAWVSVPATQRFVIDTAPPGPGCRPRDR